MTREMLRERMARFPEPIQELGLNNALVRRYMEEYAHGNIITYEEALCQMVIGLTKNWDQMAKDYASYRELVCLPIQPRL